MLVRPRVFLTCLAVVLFPLLILIAFNYWGARRAAQANLRRGLEAELEQFTSATNHLVREQESELVELAQSLEIRELLKRTNDATYRDDNASDPELRVALAAILSRRNYFTAIACFDLRKRELFVAERRLDELVIRSKDFLPGQLQLDERALSAPAVFRSPVTVKSLRSTLTLTVPVPGAGLADGFLVGELDLDSIFFEAAQDWDAKSSSRHGSSTAKIVVLDDKGRVRYHPNRVFLHQPGVPVGEVVQMNLPTLNLVALIESGSSPPWSGLWLLSSVVLAVFLACFVAFVLARFWESRTGSIDRVTEGVAAIARGDLNRQIAARSNDAMRPLSDNLNLMTAQLREQIARETETRQFQSFIKLSAMLTHDLKNAIEALSLIVGNMERHFDNEAFRADAMKSLNLATKNLRSLVDRLTNPVTTLSGEYKRPQPTDLAALLRRVVSLTAEPACGIHQIKTKLPNSLPVLADGERMEKVIENLILNGLEAMAGQRGTLSIEAGRAEPGKVFFSVSDTGLGMSREFIEHQLFRPFATTKKRGVGLGLYTCREVVRANSGTIEVDSREGAGTTFRVVLPSPAIDRTD